MGNICSMHGKNAIKVTGGEFMGEVSGPKDGTFNDDLFEYGPYFVDDDLDCGNYNRCVPQAACKNTCMELCAHTPNCLSYTYSDKQKRCYLKGKHEKENASFWAG